MLDWLLTIALLACAGANLFAILAGQRSAKRLAWTMSRLRMIEMWRNDPSLSTAALFKLARLEDTQVDPVQNMKAVSARIKDLEGERQP